MAVKSALEAMDAALASKGVPVSNDAPDEEIVPPTDDSQDEELEPVEDGDEPADEPAENESEDDADGEETDEESTDSDGDEPADESAEDETAEAKTAREAAEKAAARGTGDVLEDPIPKDLNQRTQTRMRTLIDTVKTLQPDADMGRELMSHINASNMTADEFNMALTFGRLKHSDSVDDHRKAYGILWQGLKELAPLIGETLPGVDPLEGHADLQARVTARTLDPKDAAEMAAGRNRRKADSAAAVRATQNTRTVQERAQQNQQLEQDTRTKLNQLGARLSTQDKQFEAKMSTITPAQKAKIANTPAGLRVNAFLEMYLTLRAPVKTVPVVRKQGQQPMRAGKVPAAGGGTPKREAKSAVEAMDFALGLK